MGALIVCPADARRRPPTNELQMDAAATTCLFAASCCSLARSLAAAGERDFHWSTGASVCVKFHETAPAPQKANKQHLSLCLSLGAHGF